MARDAEPGWRLMKNASRAPLGLGCTCSLGLGFRDVHERVFARSCLRGVRGDTSRRITIFSWKYHHRRGQKNTSSRCRVTATCISSSHNQSSDRDFFASFSYHLYPHHVYVCMLPSDDMIVRFSPSKSTQSTHPLTQISLDSSDMTFKSPPSQQSSSASTAATRHSPSLRHSNSKQQFHPSQVP